MTHEINLPAVSQLVEKNQISKEYQDSLENYIQRKRRNYIYDNATEKNAILLPMPLAATIFCLSWLIPILCSSTISVIILSTIFGGVLGGGLLWIFAIALLSPGGEDLLRPLVKKIANKKFTTEKLLSYKPLTLKIKGNEKTGEVTVKILNQHTNQTAFCQTFTIEQETEALEIIAEAENMIAEANSQIQNFNQEHQIETREFVKRLTAYNQQ